MAWRVRSEDESLLAGVLLGKGKPRGSGEEACDEGTEGVEAEPAEGPGRRWAKGALGAWNLCPLDDLGQVGFRMVLGIGTGDRSWR